MRDILLTGGLGDVLTILKYMPVEQIEQTPRVLICSRSGDLIRNVLVQMPVFEDKEIVRCDDNVPSRAMQGFPVMHRKADCLRNPNYAAWYDELAAAEDLSIAVVFPMIRAGLVKYQGNTFVYGRLRTVEAIGLPNRYAVICPYTSYDGWLGRSFSMADWAVALAFLGAHKIRAVVLGDKDTVVPTNHRLLDWTGKLSIIEGLEVARWASMYIGIDSFFSAFKSAFPICEVFTVKTRNMHLWEHRDIYYGPDFRKISYVTSLNEVPVNA